MNDIWESDKTRDYLGDGVYAAYDGYNVWLRVQNHRDAECQICLEPEVLDRLFKFAEKMQKAKK